MYTSYNILALNQGQCYFYYCVTISNKAVSQLQLTDLPVVLQYNYHHQLPIFIIAQFGRSVRLYGG